MSLQDFLNAGIDVINQMHLMVVIQGAAVIGIAFLLYEKFFKNRGG